MGGQAGARLKRKGWRSPPSTHNQLNSPTCPACWTRSGAPPPAQTAPGTAAPSTAGSGSRAGGRCQTPSGPAACRTRRRRSRGGRARRAPLGCEWGWIGWVVCGKQNRVMMRRGTTGAGTAAATAPTGAAGLTLLWQDRVASISRSVRWCLPRGWASLPTTAGTLGFEAMLQRRRSATGAAVCAFTADRLAQLTAVSWCCSASVQPHERAWTRWLLF